ncbi:MAG TPA: metal ABC transporter permease [Methanomassiliicoccales archaeon]|nr:metal ABC transporter permease [Methanomassiliicoccales archaeon]
MNGLELIMDYFQYAFFQRAFLSGLAAALLCSLLGVFVVLRRSSMIGEGVAHLSFGGIALGLFLSIYPLYTAMILALVGTLAISLLQRKKIVYSETAIGIIFSLGLALGAVLASMAGGFNVDLFGYLFGSILTVTGDDLVLMGIFTALITAFLLIFYKEMVQMTFDEQGARLSGVPVGMFEVVFNISIALTVVVSIKIVGSLLISALIIIPAASALQISRSFKTTVLWSVLLALVAVVCGLFTSVLFDIATGGAIVIYSVFIFILTVLMKRFVLPRSAGMDRPLCDE